ncbi:MAG: type II secretion system F family protein, partial [Acidimicrobiia bacterium]
MRSVFGPMISDAAHWVGARLDRTGTGVTLLRIRQSGLFSGSTEEEMVTAYRISQFRAIVGSAVLALVVGQLVSAAPVVRVALLALALVFGATRPRGRLEKAISARQERMKIEIYTVNQLLAMRVRAGGGVIQAVRAIVDRGRGDVVSELSEAVRLHRSGWRTPDVFRRIAELTPEPFCSRTYRLLAAAEERGADLASALLALSEDVR